MSTLRTAQYLGRLVDFDLEWCAWRICDRFRLDNGDEYDAVYVAMTKAQMESWPVSPVVRYRVRYARNPRAAFSYHRAVAPVVQV